MGNRLRSILIAVVVSVWGFNFILPVFVKSYDPPVDTINTGALALVGALIATYKNEEDKNDRE